MLDGGLRVRLGDEEEDGNCEWGWWWNVEMMRRLLQKAGKISCFLKTSEYVDINGGDMRHWQKYVRVCLSKGNRSEFTSIQN